MRVRIKRKKPKVLDIKARLRQILDERPGAADLADPGIFIRVPLAVISDAYREIERLRKGGE